MNQGPQHKTRYSESIEGKVGKSVEFIGTGGKFINRTQISHSPRSGINKWDLMKLESFCKAKDIVNKTNRQPTNWGEKSSLTPHSIDGYYPKYKRTQNIKELKNLTTRKNKQPNPKMGYRIKQGIHNRRI